MANWISKATGTFKGDESSPQAFELYCDCGQKHTGVRRQKWQRIVCRSCGGSLFVLQKDPYPPPKERPKPAPAPAVPDEDIPDEEIPVDDQLLEDDPVNAAPVSRRAQSPKAPVARPSSPAAVHERRNIAPAIGVSGRLKKEPSTGFWKPFRLILVGVVLIGTITAAVLIRSNQRATAEKNLAGAIDRIQDALRDGQWVEARNQLEIAVKSFDRLGQEGDDVKRYRQLLGETTAMTSLLSHSLGDLLQEADKASIAGADALDSFQYKVKQQWIVIEGTAVPLVTAKKRSRVQFAVPIPVTVGAENLPADVVIESAALSRLMAKSEFQSVVLAVEIDEIRPSEDGSSWQVLAVPESTVLWANGQTYQGIGYTPEDMAAVTPILQLQAQSLGVSHAP